MLLCGFPGCHTPSRCHCDQGEQRQKLLLGDSHCPQQPGPGSPAGSWLLQSTGAADSSTDGSQLPQQQPWAGRAHTRAQHMAREDRQGRAPALLALPGQGIAVFLWLLAILSFDFTLTEHHGRSGVCRSAFPTRNGFLCIQKSGVKT